MRLQYLILTSALALSACSGGGGATPAFPTTPAPITPQAKLVATTFLFGAPPASSSTLRRPQYVPLTVKSVTIALNTVNGGAPPSGLTTSVTSSLNLPSCPCTVAGPAVPPGSDAFTVTTYDAAGGAGNAISIASPTLAITAGTANSAVITLLGLPASFSITGLPSATAGTAFGTPQAFTVAVKDADGNTITGTYAHPVTIADSDTSSLTQGSALAVNGGTAASSISSTANTDTFTLNYGGLAIVPATITASATGATNGTATFAPTLAPIAYSGATNGNGYPELDFYATSGTGSTLSFTASEVGWTNAPYSKALTLTPAAGCSSILNSSTSTLSGTSFTENVASLPTVGTCTATLTDGAGQSLTHGITLTYTTTGIGVQ